VNKFICIAPHSNKQW